MIPLVQMMDNMLKGKEAENLKLTKDASWLTADAHSDMSNLRRCLKTAVAEKYWPLCNDSTDLIGNLLGDMEKTNQNTRRNEKSWK